MNVAAIRAKIRIRDDLRDIRREHVEHFIGTLDDRDLDNQLNLIRSEDADEME